MRLFYYKIYIPNKFMYFFKMVNFISPRLLLVYTSCLHLLVHRSTARPFLHGSNLSFSPPTYCPKPPSLNRLPKTTHLKQHTTNTTSNALQSCRQSSTTFAPFLSPVSWPKATPTKVATRLLHACRQSILSLH